MQNETILDNIVKDKKQWIEHRMLQQPLAAFIELLRPSRRDFYGALRSDKTVFILECKKASPSKGLIRTDFDPAQIASSYRHFASAISVLTDEKYFQGSYDYLTAVSNTVTQPVLCKDFIISPYQIYLARHYQADAILLMLSVLNDKQYGELSAVAQRLNMGILTEVSNQDELNRAVNLQAKVIGINNRDLRDLSIDLNTTKRLAPQIDKKTIVISESGIYNHHQVRELSTYANGFLIGSALMSNESLDMAIRQIIFGTNKVCGLTQIGDAEAAYYAGAIYGGLIFAKDSPRYIPYSEAEKLTASVPLKWVGVFTDSEPNEIIKIANALRLSAVQLHCDEDDDNIAELRKGLTNDCQIWQAISVAKKQPNLNNPRVDRYLLDNGKGGTGQTFNWEIIIEQDLSQIILAGGLNVDNIKSALRLNCFALDVNSGLESSPGIKDHKKISELFQTLRLNNRQ